MKFTTLIPLRFNDGREVPAALMNDFIDELTFEFSGCSDEGETKGQWIDPSDSRLYRDKSRRVTVLCDNSMLWKAEQAVIKIGQQLGQRAMYFEVRDYDGIRLLDVPEPKRRKRK